MSLAKGRKVPCIVQYDVSLHGSWLNLFNIVLYRIKVARLILSNAS
jgi:hypothetical protein